MLALLKDTQNRSIHMKFNPASIDLLRTFENFKEKHDVCATCGKSFGAPIVRMADAVITPYFDKDSVKGVKKCLEYEIGRITWRHNVWLIPVHKSDLFCPPYSEEDRAVISLLADSLMLTIIAYRIRLDKTHGGLVGNTFKEIIAGFELVCDWIHQGVKINQNENDLIEGFDIPNIESFIVQQ